MNRRTFVGNEENDYFQLGENDIEVFVDRKNDEIDFHFNYGIIDIRTEEFSMKLSVLKDLMNLIDGKIKRVE